MSILPEPDILLAPRPMPEIPLPKGWTGLALLGVLQAITLARIVLLNAGIWPDEAECDGLRLRVENDRLRGEVGLLKQEIAIKDARFERIPAKKRPAYTASEPRNDLKFLRSNPFAAGAMYKWSSGFRLPFRRSDAGFTVPRAEPALFNFLKWPLAIPIYLRIIIRYFKSSCPLLGRHRIADILAGLGLHISGSTVRRVVQEPPPEPTTHEIEIPHDSSFPALLY